MKIKKGDKVKMISGKDSGKQGSILRVVPEKNRVVVEGLNLVKKHVKPKREGEKGQRIEIPSTVDISNVMIICSACSKTTRIGSKLVGDKKVRVCKKCNKEM